ncbi:MAG: WD40 repeat domain-containing protein [Chitinophagaceae bacterium]|nr:MAG: WD40 repeat domain-containing protein [Chitinophagaceae bacterium]
MNSIKLKDPSIHTGHKSSLYRLHYVPQNRTVLSAGGDGMVVEWSIDHPESDGKVIAQIDTQIFSIALHENQPVLFIGQMNGGIHVLDLEHRKELKHLALHENSIFDLQLLPFDKSLLLAAGGDGMFSMWDTNNYDLVRKHQLSGKSLRRFSCSAGSGDIAFSSSDGDTYILDKEFKIKRILKHHKSSVFTLAYSPDGSLLVAGSRDAHYSIWDVKNNYELLMSVPAHLFTINQIAFHPSGKWFATASRDKAVKIWDTYSLKLIKVIEKDKMISHKNSVNDIIWLDDPEMIITCGDDKVVMMRGVNIQ